MKKIFSTLCITAMAFASANAQTVLFHEDFAAGVPAGWYNGGTANNSGPGTNDGTANPYVKFVRRTNQTQGSPYNYITSQGVITSPTRANGYITFNSDSLDAGSSGNPGTGPASVNQFVTLALPGINIAGHPKLLLEFYQYLSTYQSSTYLGISTDSINWHNDTLNSTLSVNGQTALADERVSLDISSITNGASTLYIRFQMDANYYFWNLDDISLYELPNNDLKITSAYGISGYSGLNLSFQTYPLSQADSISPVAQISNVGGTDQPNVKTVINLTKNGTTVNTYTTTPPYSVLAYATDTADFTTFPINAIGNYVTTLTVSSDSTDFYPADNTASFNFNVTDTVYSINQNNVAVSGYYALRNNYNLALRWGSFFEVTAADTVTSVTTAVSGGTRGTHAGSIIGATIYPVTVGASDITYSSSSIKTLRRTLVASDITTGNTIVPVNLQMDYSSGSPILTPGLYWVALEAFSTPDSNVLFATTAKQQSGMISVEEDQTQTGTLSGYSNTDAVYCNLNFGHAANTLFLNANRNPVTAIIKSGQTVVFSATSNGSNSATYVWDFTGSPYLGYTYNSQNGKVVRDTFNYTDENPDTITACVTMTDGANVLTDCITFRLRALGVGINEVSGALANVSMVPNPTTGKVNISADGLNGATTISVVNMIGETVKTFNETANGDFNKTYNLADLASGLYIVRIQNNGNSVSNRLSLTK